MSWLPPRVFATSDEHYTYLLEQAKGGTKHTITSVPRWDGLWVTAGNTHMDMFIDPPGSGFKGKVRAGTSDAGIRNRLQGALAPAAGAWRSPIRSSDRTASR